jgi:FtsP/CotA-like multicopper oxidase with cupredoxin domain
MHAYATAVHVQEYAMTVPRPAALALACAALPMLVAGCAAGDDPGSDAVRSVATSPPGQPIDATAVVTVTRGKVSTTADRVRVARGQRVVLRVTSDEPDAIHLHGYDLERPLASGKPTELSFVADQVGVFELETHESELVLLQLEVR